MSHIKQMVIAISAIFISFSALSADFRIKGLVTDSLGEPEMYATVKVFSLTDSIKPVSTGVSNDKGIFNQSLKRAGKYRLNVYTLGKNPFNHIFEITEAKPELDFKNIILTVGDNELGTVEVVATKPLVSLEVDRIGYDVQADDEAKTSMVDEILKKVPMVSVDPDGTIKINGSTDFKIYKNGRPNNSYSRNAKDIFKSLPANMIEKIEVITEPGAREDAEGVSAILNIVTLKNTITKGAMGNVSLYYSSPGVPNPNVWLSAQYDKVALSFYGGLNVTTRHSSKSSSESEAVYEQTGNILKSNGESSSTGIFGYWGMEGSWEPDTLNLVTFEFGGYNSRSKSNSNNIIEMWNGSDLLYKYNSISKSGPGGWGDLNGSINYQRSTHTKGETIIFSYRVSNESNTTKSEVKYDKDGFIVPFDYNGIISDSKSTGWEHTFQLDWTRPFGKHHTMDIGGKYIYRDNHSDTKREYINVRDEDTEFKHITSIGALFADYRLNLGKFGARAGIRYEFSHLSAKFPDGKENPFSADLNDWIPNVGLIFNPNRQNSLKLSFGSRIQRPSIYYLNPAVNESPNFTSKGNPDLESVRKNSLTFQYNLMKPKFNIGLTATYNFSNNDIISIMYTNGDHTYSDFANAGKMQNASTNIYLNWRPTTKTSFMISGGLRYNYIEKPASELLPRESAHGWGNNFFGRFAQTLPWDINLSIYANSWLSPKGLNSKFRATGWSNIYYGLDLRKSLLKEKRLTVSLGISNPFHSKNPGYVSYSWNEGYHSKSFSQNRYMTRVTVGVSYRFGKMSTSVKKVNKSIQNDDVMGGGSGNSGGGSSQGGGN